jgi:hypothetical protein
MDFITMDNVAEFTAKASIDTATPRYLHIAGDPWIPREMRETASGVTGNMLARKAHIKTLISNVTGMLIGHPGWFSIKLSFVISHPSVLIGIRNLLNYKILPTD